jgi:hypothetical protein
MKKTLLLVMCLFPVLGMAQKNENQCDFTIQCQFPKQTFLIIFHSPSQDCTNDDQEIYLQSNGKKSKLQLPKAWYFDIDNVGNQPSIGKSGYPEYPLFPLEGAQVLIILRSSSRPKFDNVAAAILDISRAKVLDYQILGASEKASTGVLVNGEKYKIQLVKEYLKEVRCDCDASYVEGWMEFQITNGKIQKHWL